MSSSLPNRDRIVLVNKKRVGTEDRDDNIADGDGRKHMC